MSWSVYFAEASFIVSKTDLKKVVRFFNDFLGSGQKGVELRDGAYSDLYGEIDHSDYENIEGVPFDMELDGNPLQGEIITPHSLYIRVDDAGGKYQVIIAVVPEVDGSGADYNDVVAVCGQLVKNYLPNAVIPVTFASAGDEISGSSIWCGTVVVTKGKNYDFNNDPDKYVKQVKAEITQRKAKG